MKRQPVARDVALDETPTFTIIFHSSVVWLYVNPALYWICAKRQTGSPPAAGRGASRAKGGAHGRNAVPEPGKRLRLHDPVGGVRRPERVDPLEAAQAREEGAGEGHDVRVR